MVPLVIFGSLIVYFIPACGAVAAQFRRAIFILNRLLAWTAIGWIVAPGWSATNPTPRSSF